MAYAFQHAEPDARLHVQSVGFLDIAHARKALRACNFINFDTQLQLKSLLKKRVSA